MILEYGQILCTTLRLNGVEYGYRITHKNHPCVQWAKSKKSNFVFLKKLALLLCKEYSFRYGKVHKTEEVIASAPLPNTRDSNLCSIKHIPQCMPPKYQVPEDPVAAYRKYYINEKSHLFKWTNRDEPQWLNEKLKDDK